MFNSGLTPQSRKQLETDFKILTITDEKSKRIIDGSAKQFRKEAMQHKNRQQSPQGQSWTPRQRQKLNKRGKNEKMLKKILKRSGTVYYGKHRGGLDYKNPVSERIAAEHQFGLVPERKTGEKQGGDDEIVARQGGATLNQATKLLEAGFNQPKNPYKRGSKFSNRYSGRERMKFLVKQILSGRNRKPSSVSYIMQNLSFEHAGLLLRLLNEAKGKTRNRNKALPARPFVNLDDEHNGEIVQKQIEQVLNVK